LRWRLARMERERAGKRTQERPRLAFMPAGAARGDSVSLPYFAVSDLAEALERVEALGGSVVRSVVHPGNAWAICRDSEGSPFGLAQTSLGG
jgi:predicted enzyme related to lactoylglutathione lyase